MKQQMRAWETHEKNYEVQALMNLKRHREPRGKPWESINLRENVKRHLPPNLRRTNENISFINFREILHRTRRGGKQHILVCAVKIYHTHPLPHLYSRVAEESVCGTPRPAGVPKPPAPLPAPKPPVPSPARPDLCRSVGLGEMKN